LLALVQALGDLSDRRKVEIDIVSTNVHPVTGRERIDPLKALLAGPFQVIPQEYSNVVLRWIDLDEADMSADALPDLAREVVTELMTSVPGSPLAFRQGDWYTRSFVEVRTPLPLVSDAGPRSNGVYLITGGWGGVGTELAKYIGRRGPCKIVLTGRKRVVGPIREIEATGAEVLALEADIADENCMREVVHKAEQRFGPVTGVIHAAGIAGGKPINTITREMAEGLFRPKIQGAEVLVNIFRGQRLDFFVLCSSVQSLVSAMGQADYVASNAYLDALAWHHRQRGGPRCISVNWDTWRGTGMATKITTGGISPDWASGAFGTVALMSFPQIAVAAALPHTAVAQQTQPARLLAVPLAESVHSRPELLTGYVEPRSTTECALALLWQRVLRIDRVGIDDGFFELGGDSILAIQVVNAASQELNLSITAAELLAAGSIRTLAARSGPGPQPLPVSNAGRGRGSRRREHRLAVTAPPASAVGFLPS